MENSTKMIRRMFGSPPPSMLRPPQQFVKRLVPTANGSSRCFRGSSRCSSGDAGETFCFLK
jgi:hypothetical protein